MVWWRSGGSSLTWVEDPLKYKTEDPFRPQDETKSLLHLVKTRDWRNLLGLGAESGLWCGVGAFYDGGGGWAGVGCGVAYPSGGTSYIFFLGGGSFLSNCGIPGCGVELGSLRL